MLRSNVPNQLLEDALPILDALTFDEYEKYPDYIPECFNMKSTNQWGMQDVTMAGLKAAVKKNEGEATAVDNPIEGYSKTYIPVTYAISCFFSEELIEDDRLNMVEDTYRSLGFSMYQTEQITAFNVYNDGFTTTGPDGVSLFNTAHPMIGGHTYGNRPSTDIALSVAGLREMEVDMMRQPNHRNINMLLMPRKIIVPPELMHTAKELCKSVDRPDTPNRAMNTFYDQDYKIVISPFLTSSTAWFGQTEPSQHKLKFVRRIMPMTKTWVEESPGTVNTKIRARWDVGYTDFIGAWGTTG